MIEERAMDEIRRVLVEEAQTDAVGLWAVLWEVSNSMPSLTPEKARLATIDVIRGALSQETVLAGEFTSRDADTLVFSPWMLSTDEAVLRIEQEWLALGREPELGEIVWFVAANILPVTALKHPMGSDWMPRVRQVDT
jgi:hypothetical protein